MLICATFDQATASGTQLQPKQSPSPVRIIPLIGMPEVAPGDDLARFLVEAGSIFVVAQKIVSKAEGQIVRLDSIKPSERAERWASEYQKDPRLIEIVL